MALTIHFVRHPSELYPDYLIRVPPLRGQSCPKNKNLEETKKKEEIQSNEDAFNPSNEDALKASMKSNAMIILHIFCGTQQTDNFYLLSMALTFPL